MTATAFLLCDECGEAATHSHVWRLNTTDPRTVYLCERDWRLTCMDEHKRALAEVGLFCRYYERDWNKQ